MIDLAALRPGDEIRHAQFPSYLVRVMEIGPRVECMVLDPPDQRHDRASLDRGDVENLWAPAWERCQGPCGREYAYPHLCRQHMLCGQCHPPVHPEDQP